MEHLLLSYKKSQISYYRYGSGLDIAVCFHGYGEEGKLYGFFEKWAGSEFTFYAIDLPFHGRTEWNEGLLFTAIDLQQIVFEIVEHNNFKSSAPGRFTLLGFSLGGRIALSFYQAQPETIEKLILLAPDGLKVNFWYWLATQTSMGSNLFAFTMKHPGWFLAFLKGANRLKLVNASILKFVNYYIGNKEARLQLYERWMCLRNLKPDRKRIKDYIRHYKTKTRLIYGKYDRIILPVRGEKFKSGIEDFCTLIVIDSGHQVVHENHVQQLLPALLH
ncbi:MAG TPA: alpha/beta hydrolase [Chitinophagaceae bacterium]|nr:alpha/beta hydrolase [Chitinophagaceae bacterium]